MVSYFYFFILLNSIAFCKHPSGEASKEAGKSDTQNKDAAHKNSHKKASDEVIVSVEVNLTPPRRPYPQLASALEMLEKRRMRIFMHEYRNMTVEFENELLRAKNKISSVIKEFFESFDDPTVITRLKTSALIETGEIDIAVVENAGNLNPEVGARVRALEDYREVWSNNTHLEGVQFFQAVTDRVVKVLNETLYNQMRPLLLYKKQALIQLHEEGEVSHRCDEVIKKHKLKIECPTSRVNPTSLIQTLPTRTFGGSVTVMKLVEDLEARRNVAEELGSNQRIYAALRLATEELKLVESALTSTVAGILEHYRDAIHILIDQYPSI